MPTPEQIADLRARWDPFLALYEAWETMPAVTPTPGDAEAERAEDVRYEAFKKAERAYPNPDLFEVAADLRALLDALDTAQDLLREVVASEGWAYDVACTICGGEWEGLTQTVRHAPGCLIARIAAALTSAPEGDDAER